VLVAGGAYGGHSKVENFMWGDAVSFGSSAAAADNTFKFGAASGLDNYIMDFHAGDHIVFDVGTSWRDLSIAHAGDGTVISDGNVAVTLVGYAAPLAHSNFAFA
jgi:hypothetical protein